MTDPRSDRSTTRERGDRRRGIGDARANLVDLVEVGGARVALAQDLPLEHVARTAIRGRRAIVEAAHDYASPSTRATLVYAVRRNSVTSPAWISCASVASSPSGTNRRSQPRSSGPAGLSAMTPLHVATMISISVAPSRRTAMRSCISAGVSRHHLVK